MDMQQDASRPRLTVRSARRSTVPVVLRVLDPMQEPQTLGFAVVRRLVEDQGGAFFVRLVG